MKKAPKGAFLPCYKLPYWPITGPGTMLIQLYFVYLLVCKML